MKAIASSDANERIELNTIENWRGVATPKRKRRSLYQNPSCEWATMDISEKTQLENPISLCIFKMGVHLQLLIHLLPVQL